MDALGQGRKVGIKCTHHNTGVFWHGGMQPVVAQVYHPFRSLVAATTRWMPNARAHLLPEAGATQEAVRCSPMLVGVGLACLKHARVLADLDRTLLRNDFFYMMLEPRQLILCQDSR
jgi:hypothetical protein